MLRKGIFTAIGLLAGTAAICHAQGPLEAADAAVQSFFQKPAKVQKQLLQRMREEAAALDGDYFAAAQAQLAAARKAASARSKLGKTKNSKSPAPQATPAWQLPALVTWRYGLGRIEPVVRVGTSQQRRRDEQRVPVALFALGMLPEADLLVADLQARMDGDRSADAFMRFLELWRNGDESFYEALDRTAGTQDSVFFYDAMLGDFVATFGKGRGDAAKHLASSLDAAHDALHRSFLSYRQYRAFREAVALAMVMPPDLPLPARLRRYEQAPDGLYSLREQVLMVLAANDHDPRKVAALVAASAPPLPDPLWSSTYDPYPGWSEVFAQAMPDMIAAAGDTTKFLEQARRDAMARAERVRARAREVLGPSPSGKAGAIGQR